MAEAKRDQNRIPTLIGVSDVDGTTPTLVYVEPTTNRLYVDALVTGGFGNQDGVVDNEVVDVTDTGVLILGTDGSNYQILSVNSDGELNVNLETSDIEIGAVELKDAGTDTRANILAANTARTTATIVVATQAIDAAGAVLSTSALATSAKQLADGHNVTVDNGAAGSAVNIQDGGNTITVQEGAAMDVSAATVTVDGTVTTTPSGVQEIEGDEAEGGNLPNPVLIGGDDGTDIKNVHVDATTGDVQVDLTAGTATIGEVTIGAATGAAGDLAKIEDAQHSTGDVGVMALAVENEDQADLSTGDKDYTPIAVTKEGNIIVKQEGTIAVTESTPLTGFATSALQLPDGHAVTVDNISSNEVYVRGSQTAGSAVDGEVVTVQGIASMTAIATTESSPISGFATSAGQLADGHNVTIDNISTDEVYVRGGGTAGSAVDGEVVAVQGIASGTAMAVTESSPLSGFATSAKQLADGHNVVVSSGTITTVTTLTGTTTLTPGTAATNLGKAEDAAHSTGDVGVMALGVENEDQAALSGGDKDYTPIALSAEGNVLVEGTIANSGADAGFPHKIGGRAQDVIGVNPEEVSDNDRVDTLHDTTGRVGVFSGSNWLSADINDASSGDNTIIAATADMMITVWAILIVSDGTVDVRWESGAAGTAKSGQVPLEAREGYSISAGGLVPLFQCASNTLLNLELSAAINCHGFVSYTLEYD